MHITFLGILALFLPTAAPPHNVTMEDFFRNECNAGKQVACEKLTELKEGLELQEQLQQRSVEFWKKVDTRMLMLDKKRPDLHAAYPLVIRDYIESKRADGINENVNESLLPECARHYHNYWINKKLWYPANDDGTPDWPSIYVFIVDHYYGYCLRSAGKE